MKLGIVALPVAYLIGWLAMLAAETPLLSAGKSEREAVAFPALQRKMIMIEYP